MLLFKHGLKEALEYKNIKQKWLTEKLGKSKHTVSSYVQNRRQPSLEGRILEVSAKDLLIEKEGGK